MFELYFLFLLEINKNLTAKFKTCTEALIYDLIHKDIILRPYLSNIEVKNYYKLKKNSLELSPEFGSREYLYHETSEIDYGTRLLESCSSNSSNVSNSSNASNGSNVSNGSNDGEISSTRRNYSDTESITSIEVQNTSRGCLSKVINKLSFKKLILNLF